MKIKRTLGICGIVILLFALAGYHYLFGYIVTEQIDDSLTLLHRKNIFHQIGANVTIYAGSRETIVVDTQLRPLAPSTQFKIKSLSNAPVSRVIVTHWHPDHSGGISFYLNDADVIAHENVLHRLSNTQQGFGLTKPGSHHVFEARSSIDLPNVLVGNKFQFSVDEKTIDIVHFPSAHSAGDLVVVFKEAKTAVLGDLIWPNSFPFIDVYNGGSVEGLESALRAILQKTTSKYRFIPGHGTTQTFDDVSEYLEMVSQTRQWVETRMDNGESLSQLLASGLPAQWIRWGSSLVPSEVWIKMIYDSHVTPAVIPQNTTALLEKSGSK